MGCDIHAYVETKIEDSWVYNSLTILDYRNYGVFGFLADVRNYSAIAPIKEPLYEIPEDCSKEVKSGYKHWGCDAHTASCLTLEELLAVDYNKEVWDRRVTRELAPNYLSGGCTTDNPQEGKRLPLKDFLGSSFMGDLKNLQLLNFNPKQIRIVFWFDN